MAAVTGIFFSKGAYHTISVPARKILLDAGVKLLEFMSVGEAYNLVDISIDKVKIVIEVK
ncbi:hypothetical protein acsn021_05570 [Anaerocolumna cellulosilytica]|uniref:Uncharacterized protein n=1 Tax=Anaerocolumna cellulosilytica TaxID=433286 RepID=A0A6S6R1V5_9FIRM|nr:hypothetical protein [Anaerocolumna cellulosilytica]MBB5195676.1 hypothetical protein [Anaerocolumna cellulosilytica]BCJ92988.1 hypothetical protein acsn021_05570 [Anaerocolumna cellulosilytica]